MKKDDFGQKPIFTLMESLDLDLPTIRKSYEEASAKREQLRTDLEAFQNEDASIVVFGSLARNEFTSGSDIDWTLLIDGSADPAHLTTSLAVEKYVAEIEGRKPGREGTFGGLAFSHDIIHRIGGGDDTNKNMTQRILLLLESAPIGRTDAYDRVIRNILKRYVEEDFSFSHLASQYGVPRFLLNDIIRYWRTVTVDFAYKERLRGGEGWALRNAKLRLSRKLTYVSGLLLCYSCHEKRKSLGSTANEDSTLLLVEHLVETAKATPLDILAQHLLPYSQLHDSVIVLLTVYNEFLDTLDSAELRASLEKLPREKIGDDELYNKVRDLGHKFQEALSKIFLEKSNAPYYELTKTYGVF